MSITTKKIFPSSDDTVTFTPSTGVSNFALVDEDPPDDADYNSRTNSVTTDRFNFVPFNIDPAARNISLNFTLRSKKGGIYNLLSYTCIWMYDAGTTSWVQTDNDNGALTSSFADYSYSWTTNPETGNPWKANELDRASTEGHLGYIGYHVSGGPGRVGSVSNIYFTITYDQGRRLWVFA